MRLKAIISYRGTAYYGYQLQTRAGEISIQEVIEGILRRIFSQDITIFSSGRTDRGVHALGQVIHFDIPNDEIDLGKLKWSINSMLPNDIHFISLVQVRDDFHARYNAISKEYRYIVNPNEHNPLVDDLVYNYHRNFDLEKIKEVMELFVGTHNFYNFCSNEDGNFVRTIDSFTLKEENGYMIFSISGNGFRRYMVRMIVGTCLEAGLNKISKEDILSMLDNEEMKRTRFKAPACGLYLVNVNYGGEDDDKD